MSTAAVKKLLIDTLTPMLANFQKARAAVTDQMVHTFFSIRKIDF